MKPLRTEHRRAMAMGLILTVLVVSSAGGLAGAARPKGKIRPKCQTLLRGSTFNPRDGWTA